MGRLGAQQWEEKAPRCYSNSATCILWKQCHQMPEREQESAPVKWFTPQVPAAAGTEVRGRDFSLSLPCGWQELSLPLSKVCVSRKMESGALGRCLTQTLWWGRWPLDCQPKCPPNPFFSETYFDFTFSIACFCFHDHFAILDLALISFIILKCIS